MSGEAPSISEGDPILLTSDPPTKPPGGVIEGRLVHLDAATGRLIVAPADANEPFPIARDTPLLVLVVRPGEPMFARSCRIEARLDAAGWVILLPTAAWRRIERRLVERAVVTLLAEGHRYMTTGGGLPVRGTIRDLSTTGFCFESAMPVGLGELVVLDAHLPGDEVLRIRGQAVRIVRPASHPRGLWQVGCQLWSVPLADQQRIARLLGPQGNEGAA